MSFLRYIESPHTTGQEGSLPDPSIIVTVVLNDFLKVMNPEEKLITDSWPHWTTEVTWGQCLKLLRNFKPKGVNPIMSLFIQSSAKFKPLADLSFHVLSFPCHSTCLQPCQCSFSQHFTLYPLEFYFIVLIF